jgi:predicted nucleic acid-binding protein
VGEIPIVLCSLTVAEIGHGIYRADTLETRKRRRTFLDELKATVPIYPITEPRLRLSHVSAASKLLKG